MFPKLDETDDPEYIRNAITYIKKSKRFIIKSLIFRLIEINN